MRALLDALDAGRTAEAGGLWGSSPALLLAVLLEARGSAAAPLVVATADGTEAEILAADLALFAPEADVSVLPASTPGETAEDRAARTVAAGRLSGGKGGVFIAPAAAWSRPTFAAAADLAGSHCSVAPGDRLDRDAWTADMEAAGLESVPIVEEPGQMSVRGCVLDLFPPGAQAPLRIELDDETVESVRTFDAGTQMSVEEQECADVWLPAADTTGDGTALVDLLPQGAVWVRLEPTLLAERWASLADTDAPCLAACKERAERGPTLDLCALPSAGGADFLVKAVEGLGNGMSQAWASLEEARRDGGRVVVFSQNQAEQRRLEALLRDQDGDPGAVALEIGNLGRGFRWPAAGLTCLTQRELAGTLTRRRIAPHRARRTAKPLAGMGDLRKGDLVVHGIHGLGRFTGRRRIQHGGGASDHLVIEYRGGTELLVPEARLDLVGRYVGSGKAAPRLDKIGGRAFKGRKARVEAAVAGLADELLEIQALRETSPGVAVGDGGEMARDFEASFPYEPTPDQAEASEAVRADQARPHPMDRLLCGDVGFGKTEVAVRAAFRAALAGRQTALLVPTTLLAQQHERTFGERMAGCPVEIRCLTRFSTPLEQAETLAGVAEGRVEILIGTHRILSGDVVFSDLGLVVIDEEQRFGVAHKERLKRLRASVDVLTMTATPIPRTMHMALSGLRDVSSITTAPAGREAVETGLRHAEDDAFIREALIREMNRGGQAFFLHNRVHSIRARARDLERLVPEARLAVAHGQLPKTEIEDVMGRFLAGDIDVLVTTTIIESGLDIPRANTIFIDQAHMFGLADLHQLRGRVGRWRDRAACWLLVPKNEPLPEAARERLKAIEDLTHLGSGFRIAMRDMEIRGAGNLLGSEQSGHIAAVGYDFYCRLLAHAVAVRKGDEAALPPTPSDFEHGADAYLPESWIPDEPLRFERLRAFDGVRTPDDRDAMASEMADRFGPMPEPARTLLDVFLCARLLAAAGVSRATRRPDRLIVNHGHDTPPQGWFRDAEVRPVKPGHAHVMLPAAAATARGCLDWLESVLFGDP